MPNCRMRMNEISTASGNVMQITKRTAEVHQDQQHGQRRDDRLVRQHFGERVDRAVDQPRAVVERHDPHASRQARLEFDRSFA